MRSEKNNLMRMVFTICWGMSGNGAGICTMKKPMVRIVFFVGVAGQKKLVGVAQQAAAAVSLHLQ